MVDRAVDARKVVEEELVEVGADGTLDEDKGDEEEGEEVEVGEYTGVDEEVEDDEGLDREDDARMLNLFCVSIVLVCTACVGVCL